MPFPSSAARVTGAHCEDRLGTAVATGDVGGDGDADLVLGAPNGRIGATGPRRGEAYVLTGPVVAPGRSSAESNGCRTTGASPADGVHDLALDPARFLVLGIDESDGFGESAVVLDLDGDGRADVAFGAPGGDGPDGKRKEAGEVHVLLGVGSMVGSRDLRLRPAHVVVYGATAGDRLGTVLASGDVTGDGVDDLVLGAPDALASKRKAAGMVVVVAGVANPPATVDLAKTDARLTISGAFENDRLGAAVAVADLDGDGVDDVVAGAPGASPSSRTAAGAAYAIRIGAAKRLDLRTTTAHATLHGPLAGDQLGAAVALCDVDADGLVDVALGAPFADGPGRSDAGAVHVVAGNLPSGTRNLAARPAEGLWRGAAAAAFLGARLAAGEVNGDGRCEVAVSGAVGVAHVVLGRSTIPTALTLGDGAAPVRTFVAPDATARLGVGLAFLDSTLVLGAPAGDGASGTRSDAGEAWLFERSALLRAG